MARAYRFQSPVGLVWVRPQPGTDRYRLGIETEPIGSYHSPEAAADDVANRASGWRPLDLLLMGPCRATSRDG